MTYLEVDGASLYYESVGRGSMLLCITGAIVQVEPWKGVAERLKEHFTVVMYDRRGFSRSHLSGPQDYAHRIETDADDAARLVGHLSPDEGAFVLGNSSGAVVAFELLVRHPNVVRSMIAHEPPAHKILPDFNDLQKQTQAIYDLYRDAGMPPALEKFAEFVKLGPYETPGLMYAFHPHLDPLTFSNAQYWFEREILYYPAHDFDVEQLKKQKAKLTLAVGEATNPEAGHYRVNVILAETLGFEVVKFPAGHVGFMSHPKQYAQKLLQVLGKD